MKSTCLIIVTFNRLRNLRVAVEAAKKNAASADILVVDNSSTDGTHEWLAAQEGVHALTLSMNLGGAGGFAAGLEWGFDNGYEWLWLMDDDVVPLPGGLEALLRHGRDCPCVQPSKLDAKGRVFEFEGIVHEKSLRRSRLPYAKVFARTDRVPCNAACFEGLFLNRRAVETVGFPDLTFFMGWDDIHYGMRLARKMPLVYVKDFCLQKQFDKEKVVALGRRWFSSTPASRARHLRNMRQVIALDNLGWRAWLQYAYEWSKVKALDILGVGGR